MAETTIREDVEAAIALSGIEGLSAGRRLELETFAGEVALWSSRLHLIGRGNLRSNLRLLVLDSLLLLRAAEEAGFIPGEGAPSRRAALRIADIGSGAGFPGMVWKIARPDLSVTLFERKERVHAFLGRVISTLGLEGLSAVSEDAEFYARKSGPFEIVTSKAAGRLSLLLPLAAKLLAPEGVYLTIKGERWRSELESVSPGAMRLLAARELPEGRGVAISFKKISSSAPSAA